MRSKKNIDIYYRYSNMSTCSLQSGGAGKRLSRRNVNTKRNTIRRRKIYRGGEGESYTEQSMQNDNVQQSMQNDNVQQSTDSTFSTPSIENNIPANPSWEDRKRQMGDTSDKLMSGLSNIGSSFGSFTESIGNSVSGFGNSVKDRLSSISAPSMPSNPSVSSSSASANITGGGVHRRKTKNIRKQNRQRRTKRRTTRHRRR